MGPSAPTKPGAVDAEDDRQVLEGDFLEDLVVRALEERAVDVDDRPGAGLGHASGERHRVALADAHVEKLGRECVANLLELVALAHGGGDHGHPGVAAAGFKERVADGVGVGAARRGLERDDPVARLLKRRGRVELDRVFHGRLEAVPLVGQDVQQDRPVERLDALEVDAQRLQVVPVDRPQVDKPQLLEEHSVVQRGLDRVFELLKPALGVFADQGDVGQERFDPFVPVVVGAGHPARSR